METFPRNFIPVVIICNMFVAHSHRDNNLAHIKQVLVETGKRKNKEGKEKKRNEPASGTGKETACYASEGNITASHRNALLVVRIILCVIINLLRYRNFLSLRFLRPYIFYVYYRVSHPLYASCHAYEPFTYSRYTHCCN